MRAPKLNTLKVFDAAARHLNFRAAAAELNVTQGAVAQSIRGLEADLGVRLFKRLARGVVLTEAGETYHLDVARGLEIIHQATEKLYSGSDTVTVSVPPSFASKWLVPRLPYFFEANPNINVRTIASEAVTNFRLQDVDVAVRQGPRPADVNLLVIKLSSDRLGIVCSASNAPSPGTISGLESFADLPLIQDGHRHWENLFKEQGIKCPEIFLKFNQSALAMDAAVNGQGFAVVPRLLASDDVASGQLKEVWTVPDHNETGFWLVYPDDAPYNRKARSLFVDWVRSSISNH